MNVTQPPESGPGRQPGLARTRNAPAYPDGVPVAEALALAVGELLGVGVLTTTATVGQPNGTVGREILGVGEALGEAWAWITIGVLLGHGGVCGTGVGEAALTISATRTASPPRMTVPTKVAAPHSLRRKSRFSLNQAPS